VGVVALIVLATVALLVRTLSAPLRRLSDNSQLIGTSARIEFEETRGPRELRRLSRALNEMQDRIEGLIAQRTNALAAVSHDLRTPLARLRLRLSSIDDPDDRMAAERDIGEMGRMLQELLDYFDSGENGRERESIDLASLCSTICEEFEDLGADVVYRGPERLTLPAHYDPLRRAITNLVDNAVKYGGRAELSLSNITDGVAIEVNDEGPGIPDADLDRVLLPFERSNIARGDAHPGIGLGLSIARRAADQHGGRLQLRNRQPSGLSAVLFIPRG
jgi:signal transduction histidine kinase